jgi:hypothetical protein
MFKIIDMIQERGLTHFEILGDGKLPTRNDVAIFDPESGDIMEIENMHTNILRCIELTETHGCIERV